MAITFWWLGHATTTTARVCVRGTTDGAVYVACNGGMYYGTVATDTADGVATVDVTGLSPNTTYSLTITDASGATASGQLRTMPSVYGKVAFISCEERTRSLDDLSQNIMAFGAQAVVHEGDYVYMATQLSGYNGETAPAITTSSTAADYATHWRQCKRKSDKRLLETSLPHYYMFDDHEFGGDNWDHSVTQAQATLNVASGGTQAQVDASWWAGRQASGYYMLGNPATDAGYAAEKPPNAAAGTPVSQYPVCYYRFTVGDIEVFHIDCFSYRSILTATDNASKTMLGATQKAWLKAKLDASTAPFKIIASGKTTYYCTSSGTGDDWTKYATERDELIAYINANASGNLRGVVWMCGDAHGAFVTYNPTLGHIAVCCNPAGVDRLAQASGYTQYTVWKESGNSGAVLTLPAVFGLAEVTDVRGVKTLIMRVINQYGAELWRGTVDAGTNVLR